jgi:hypothetical protein
LQGCYNLIVDNQITTGFLNYDTQIARYQLKDAETKSANIIKNLDLIECKLEGNISKCRLFGCEIKNCQIEDSNFVMNNDIFDSKMTDCDLGFSNKISNSYIDSKDREIGCEVTGGVIRSGYVTSTAIISPETEVISSTGDAKGKGKGKGDKMVKTEVFPDRNEDSFLSGRERFTNLNDKLPSYSANRYLNKNI